ncbi:MULTISPECIES: hypothetical protein [Acinetobacter]|uniref:Uncharacterized protein n=1 Tax=Acinetobacter higginsii TaxID=70347 RepID=N9T1T1_9GAMM|nr:MULTISPECIES: hypothetical protein [Acinetobacter]ENX57632.1 hypothetical protein F902_02029 [Acinetobacter higginsii]
MMDLTTNANIRVAKALLHNYDSRMYIERDSFFDSNFHLVQNENDIEQLRTAVKNIELKPGAHVHVDFTHQLEKNSHEIHFHGEGVLDRVEDGRVYGRLSDGRSFTCMFADVVALGEVR